jgi:hypothetical protein
VSKPRVIVDCVANRYAGHDERIVEFFSPGGGGLIALREVERRLLVDVYRLDATVKVRVAKAEGRDR